MVKDRTKAALATAAFLMESCAQQLAYRVPETYAEPVTPEETAAETAPPPAPLPPPELCTPIIAANAAAMARHASPIGDRQDETLVMYTLTTDRAFNRRYGKEAEAIAAHYIEALEQTSALISEHANVRFIPTGGTMPKDPGEMLWFNIMLTGGESLQQEAGRTTVTEQPPGTFHHADLLLFVPAIGRMGQSASPPIDVAPMAVQHELGHALGLKHIDDVFEDMVVRKKYSFTASISPQTTAMTQGYFVGYDGTPELDLCALQQLYGKREHMAASEVEPSEMHASGSSSTRGRE